MADGRTPYTPSGTWPDLDGSSGQGPLELQDDGQVLQYALTFRNDSDPKVGLLAKLIDGLYYLWKRSKAGTRACPRIFINDPASTRTPTLDIGTASPNSASLQALDPPHGSTLSKVTLYVDPSNVSPPAGTKVYASVLKRKLSDGTSTQIGVDTTDPTTGTDYGDPHSFDIDCGNEVIDCTAYTYLITLYGETGSGAAFTDWYGSTYTAS